MSSPTPPAVAFSRRKHLWLVWVWLLMPAWSHAESKPWVRAWFEAGPSFEGADAGPGDSRGYALGGGIELGRKLGFVLSGGYEHYAGEVTPHLVQTGQSPPIVRVEGDVTKPAFITSFGLRYAVPLGRVDVSIQGGLGSYTIMQREARWVDPDTGALVAGGGVSGSSSVLSEIGLGVRTRRSSRFDWTLGVRLRGYAQAEGVSGSSFQVGLGIVSR